MELNEIFKYIAAIWHEINLHKFKSLFMVSLISFAILIAGIFNHAVYNSEVTIFADTQNIIKPLLGKQAEVTSVKQSRTTQVRDIIYSPRQMSKVIDSIYGRGAFSNAADRAEKIAELRNKLSIEGLSGNYIKISYQDNNPKITFSILNETVRLFVEDSANTKKDESRSAFNFIEQQVESYKTQLSSAEERLKHFKSTHLDGTESEVESRISTIRNDIEDMKIQEMESMTRIYSLKQQLNSQDKFSSNDYEASLYHSRLNELEQQLKTLLLTYKDDYPAVSEIRYQIADMKTTIKNLGSEKAETQNDGSDFNPLYQEISSKLSDAQVAHNTIRNRLEAFERLLEEAYERRKRVANNQAELSELSRDYTVVKKLYEDMLANKEKARLSMVLDIEGQGVNYKIQEPANYPTVPSGLRFLHFFLAGPIAGLLILVGLFTVKVILDNKLRFASQLEAFTSTPLLISIKHTENESERRKKRHQNITLLLLASAIIAIYVGIAIAEKYEISILNLIAPLSSKLMELMK